VEDRRQDLAAKETEGEEMNSLLSNWIITRAHIAQLRPAKYQEFLRNTPPRKRRFVPRDIAEAIGPHGLAALVYRLCLHGQITFDNYRSVNKLNEWWADSDINPDDPRKGRRGTQQAVKDGWKIVDKLWPPPKKRKA